jgi:ankyrin repeat protein
MSKFGAVLKAAKKGDVEKMVQLMEEEKININEIDAKSGQGLIHIAIEHDDEEMFAMLVGRPGIDLELGTSQREVPLEMAVRLNSPWFVGKLLDHGVNYRIKNGAGETVLHTALRNLTHRDILKRLTHNKFDLNEPIEEFGSYLNLAIVAGHPENFDFLIKELGIDYTKKFDNGGNSCLILAVKKNKGDFVAAILDKLK